MKLTFRVTLLTILLSLVMMTVVSLVVLGYSNGRTVAADLSRQVLEQTALRIDQVINSDCSTAAKQVDLELRQLASGHLRGDDFASFADYWKDLTRVYPNYTRLGLGLEATGEWMYFRRTQTHGDTLGELRRNPQSHKLELREYRPADFPKKPYYFNPDRDYEDVRRRPWYVAAKKAGQRTWSDTYVFYGSEGVADIPGVSCAAPFYRADGSLIGVITASFDLYEICNFLSTLHIGQDGFAFVIEYRQDGTRRVIGHSNPDTILRVVSDDGVVRVTELVPIEDLADARLKAFLESIPTKLLPAELEGLHEVRFAVEGEKYFGVYSRLSTDETPDWVIGIVIPQADVMGKVQETVRRSLQIAAVVFILAILLSWFVSQRISRSLVDVQKETEAVGHLDLEPRPPIRSEVYEVDRLGQAVEEMKAGLRSFRKYVPTDLVRSLLASGQEAALGGERRTVTISFSDVADFTSIAERLTPEQLVEQLGEYLTVLSEDILAASGTVDKYIGDAIMAFWGAPTPDPRHALGACTAAIRNQQRLKELQQKWTAEGKPAFRARIGLATGDVVVGNIGSPTRMNYTVIGDAVNLASRLEGLNKYYGTSILLSDQTYAEVQADVVARPMDWVSVKGKRNSILVYELLALKGEAPVESVELASVYGRALHLYREQNWIGAVQCFEQALQVRAGDPPSLLMITRCRHYQAAPPESPWDGAHRMESK